jgi:hypothetical protein
MSVIPATWEVEIRRIVICGQPRQKVSGTPSQQISQAEWHVPVIPTIRKTEVGGPDKSMKTLSEK